MPATIYKLRSSDSQVFEVGRDVVDQSSIISEMIAEMDADAAELTVPLGNVNGATLARVVEYCQKHAGATPAPATDDAPAPAAAADDALKQWDAEFVKDLSQEALFDVLLAANYLDVATLLDLACQTVADMIKGKTTEQIRATFNIVNDLTPEEEAEVARENAWAFD